MRIAVVVVLASLAASCETLGFYRQAVAGELSILKHRQSTQELVNAKDTDAALRERLLVVARLVQFAADELSLEPGDRYTSYVRIDGAYVVWNVFATAEFSTSPTRWCYPIAGCAAYRGYFDQRDAVRYARRLMVGRQDTTVGGVAAYSTLGWFADPVLSTFIEWSDTELAGLIFHELAHAKLYVRGDTAFNEAFASFVERRGVFEWLRAQHDDARIDRVTTSWRTADRFVDYLLKWRDELQLLFDQPYNAEAGRLLKAALLAEAERCYRANRSQLGDQDWFFRDGLSNARFVPFAAYHELVAGFEGLFAQADESWPAFYASARALARMPADARTAELTRLGRGYRSRREPGSDPIECDSLRF